MIWDSFVRWFKMHLGFNWRQEEQVHLDVTNQKNEEAEELRRVEEARLRFLTRKIEYVRSLGTDNVSVDYRHYSRPGSDDRHPA